MLAQQPPTPPPRNAVTVTVAASGSFHRHQQFAITVAATLKRRDRHAYLLSFIQYSARPCLSDASKELQRTLPSTGAYYHHQFSRSPFAATVTFTAGAPGTRRVCAYLYKKPIKPGAKTRPMATGTATYTVIP